MAVPASLPKTTTTKPSSSSESSTKKLFIRDRIAKKKEVEDAELGAEENETEEKNDLFVKDDHVGMWPSNRSDGECYSLSTYSITDDELFRDSYILTMTQCRLNESEDAEDSFDVTQMADAAFESFTEVVPL